MTSDYTEVLLCIVAEAAVKQVSGDGMPVCLEALDRLSLGVSLRAISQPLVEKLGAVSFASDNSVEDIFFTAKILLTPATRSDNALIMF